MRHIQGGGAEGLVDVWLPPRLRQRCVEAAHRVHAGCSSRCRGKRVSVPWQVAAGPHLLNVVVGGKGRVDCLKSLAVKVRGCEEGKLFTQKEGDRDGVDCVDVGCL